jgi:DNA polymerase-4
MDRFHGCYQWTNELSQSITKETGLLSFALSLIRRFQNWNGESKPIGKLEIPETMVKLLNPLSIQKIPMVGDVTFQLLSRIGIRTIQTLSEMPAEVLQQMIGKTVLISEKSKWY